MGKKSNIFTIRDICQFVKWKDVKRAIKYHYPTDKNDYEELFYSLPKRKIVKVPRGEVLTISGGLYCAEKEKLEKFDIEYLERLKSEDEQLYYSIYIKKEGEEYRYSCSFVAWDYMTSLPIYVETLRDFTFIDIIAHFIWEITFYGNEKQMKKVGGKIQKAYEDIKSGKAKTVALEDTKLGKQMQKTIDK